MSLTRVGLFMSLLVATAQWAHGQATSSPEIQPFGKYVPPRAAKIEFTPPPNVVGQSAWIPLHHQAQETNLCVPTSASIILDYFGRQISPREIKELSMGREYSPDQPFSRFHPHAIPRFDFRPT